jgi:hypothetical protein
MLRYFVGKRTEGLLNPDFFELQTQLAGVMLRKFVNYRLRVAVMGDFSELASNSAAPRAFTYESNRGDAANRPDAVDLWQQRLNGLR